MSDRLPTITKDDVTVAKEIELKDAMENMGVSERTEPFDRVRQLAKAQT